MKRFLILLSIIYIPAIIGAQPYEEINGKAYDKDGYLLNGKYLTVYENGQVKEEINFKNYL